MINRDTDCCSICLDSLEDDISVLKCGHQFHTTCIEQWKKKSETCPICRLSNASSFNDEDDIVLPVALIKFRCNRIEIIMYTFTQILLHCLCLLELRHASESSRILYMVAVILSTFGFYGAQTLNVYMLYVYAVYLAFTVSLRWYVILNLMILNDYTPVLILACSATVVEVYICQRVLMFARDVRSHRETFMNLIRA